MKRILLSLIGIISLGFLLFGGSFPMSETAYAACTPEKIAEGIPCSDKGFEAPDQHLVNEKINEKDFRVQVLKIVNYFLTFLGLLAVVAVVYAGIILVGDFGGEENVGKAKNILTWAAAGIILILLSYSFVNWVIGAGDGPKTDPVVVENPQNPGNNLYLDDIEKILENLGKLDQNTLKLLDLISKKQLSKDDFQDQFAAIAEAITNYSLQQGSYFDTLKKAMEAQGYDANIADNLIDKINNGESLTDEEYNQLKNSLRYGLVLSQLETELNILYKSMPQTASNVAAYNDVITLLMEVKNDPSNAVVIQKLKDAFYGFKQIIQNTPAVTAHINASPASGSAPLVVTFDGSDSTDPNDQTIPKNNFTWSFLDGSGTEKTIGKGAVIEYEFTEPGLYVVTLRAETAMKENGYKTAMDGIAKVKIKVNPPASNLQIAIDNKLTSSVRKIHISKASEGVTFDAGKSVPRVGRKIVEYKWNFGDGSIDYSENGDPITHAFNKVGQYTVRLETKDNTGETTYKEVKVIVEHLTAEIDIAPLEGTTRTTFDLNALKSKSSDFVIQKYLWTITDENGKVHKESDKDKTDFQTNTPGNYTVKLTITDSERNSTTESYTLKIKSLAPNASFIARPKASSHPALFVFNASSSSDTENDSLNYSWDFNGDGVFETEQLTNAVTEYLYQEAGSYKPLLKVTDAYGESDTISQTVTVESTLAVDFEISTIAVHAGQEAHFTPQSNSATSYYWDFGDGNTESGTNTSHTYAQAGNYIITLTAFDAKDNENSVSKRIFVGDMTSPVAAFQLEVDGATIYPEKSVCGKEYGITVSRRDNIKFMGTPSINIDGTGHMLDYTWNFGDGEYGNTKVASHRYSELNEKCFEVSLTVKDRTTGKSDQTQIIGVKVVNLPPTLQKLLLFTSNSDQKELFTPQTIRLQAQGAIDPDGTIQKYRWWYRKTSDPKEQKRGIVQTQEPSANILIESDGLPGMSNEYIFVVEMTDNEGRSINNEDILEILPSLEVKNGNVNAPQVAFTMDKNQIYTGDTVSFFAELKGVPAADQYKVKYEWDFNGDNIIDDSTSGIQVARRFDAPGEFDVRLRVQYQGLTTSTTQKLYVDSVSRYPLAAFTYEVNDFILSADASNSKYDPSLKDTRLRFSWDFNRFEDSNGDGDPTNDNESNDLKVEHVYGQEGPYYVTLRVKDSLGTEDIVERSVMIRRNLTGDTNIGNQKPEKRSPRITARNNPITTLDLSLEGLSATTGVASTISAYIVNADGSLYSGDTEFEIMEGKAVFENDTIKAFNGVAKAKIIPLEEGTIVIKAKSKNTFYQTLEETLSFQVSNKNTTSYED